MSGGGGSTGEVSFPEHMEETHRTWLEHSGSGGDPAPISVTLIDVMETAFATNPLDTLSYTDPATDIAEIESAHASWETDVNALDETADWTAVVDNVVSKVDSAGVLQEIDMASLITDAIGSTKDSLDAAVTKALEMADDIVIEQAVDAFANARRRQQAQVRTRYKAQMSNIGAERSSAYALGLALVEIDLQREIGDYQKELSFQTYQQGMQFFANHIVNEIRFRLGAESDNVRTRNQMLQGHIQLILSYKQFIFDLRRQVTELLAEIKRIGFVMDSEYVSSTGDLNWKHSSWDLNVYKNAVNVLGGIGGSQFVPDGPTKAGSAIGGAMQGVGSAAAVSGALAGAGQGAAAGAVGGPIGLAAGAVLGLGMGLLS